jgi:ATP adenylyltransferase
LETYFTPWRLSYIKSEKNNGGCIFCKIFEEQPSFDNLVVFKNEHVAILLNRFPYNNAHLLVVPRSHRDSLTLLTTEEEHSLSNALVRCEKALRALYDPNGINIGMNLGQAAGAGITEHIHYHILPRWHGDTNFVTIVSKLRVIPEDLKETYNALSKYFSSGG